jgi:dopamine beta-monooxygenase
LPICFVSVRFSTSYNTPIEFKASDELRIHCTYQSIGKNTTTFYGEGTSDEMCFGFVIYYPANDDLTYCSQWRSVNVCTKPPLQCDTTTLHMLVPAILANCNSSTCSNMCKYLMMAAGETDCLSPDMSLFLQLRRNLQEMPFILHALDVCDISTSTDPTTSIPDISGSQPMMKMTTATSAAVFTTTLLLTILAAANQL